MTTFENILFDVFMHLCAEIFDGGKQTKPNHKTQVFNANEHKEPTLWILDVYDIEKNKKIRYK